LLEVSGRSMIQLQRIGRGGSCEVFQVITRDTLEILALKKMVVPKACGGGERGEQSLAMEGMRNEIDLLRKLKGKAHCIQMLESEVIDDRQLHCFRIFMLFECGEIDLAHYLKKRGGALPVPEVKPFWKQMLLAVHTVHGFRIVHGDLKPANFLMVRGELKLIDFGIAKQIGSNETTHIARDAQIGTLNYIAPEALIANDAASRDCYKLGRSADVWSMGCILHQMLFGMTPFTPLKFAAKLQAIISKSCRALIRVHPNPFVNDIVARCLRREPTKRCSVEELLQHRFHDDNEPDFIRKVTELKQAKQQILDLKQQLKAAQLALAGGEKK